MNPLTQEWIRKAEADYRSMIRESQISEEPNLDDLCFHAEQCCEKYLKAFLQELGLRIPRTHDLDDLLTLILPHRPEWSSLRFDCKFLRDFAVEFRYPGEDVIREDVERAMASCKKVRSVVREAFKDIDQLRLT
jgi:HEPN domain-containing protein